MRVKNLRLKACVWGVLAAAAVSGSAIAQEKPTTLLEEIVVTAQKRSESLQEVPVAISAFTSETRDLIGIKTIQDLTNFTPGITYQTSLDRMTVRGIGRLTNNLATDPGVATYANGVFSSSNWSAGLTPMFIDRTEVLRGPQGTLYGRNSIGGAINVVGKRPSDQWGGEVRAAGENYSRTVLEARVTGPITDWLRFSVGGNSIKQNEGYFHNVDGGPGEGGIADDYYGEAQLAANFGSAVDVWFLYSHWEVDRSERNSALAASTQTVTPYDNALYPPSALSPSATYCPTGGPCNLPARPSIADHRAYATNFPNQITDPVNTFNLEVIGHLSWADLKYIGGHTDYLYHAINDNNGTNRKSYVFTPPNTQMAPVTVFAGNQVDYVEDKSYYSNEVNLISTGDGSLQWILGAYQYHEEYEQYFSFYNLGQPQLAFQVVGTAFLPNPGNETYRNTTIMDAESRAVFGQLDYRFSDSFKATLGYRYTQDKKEATERLHAVTWGLSAFYPASVFLTPYGLTAPYYLNGGIYTTPGGPTLIPNSATPPLSVASALASPSGGTNYSDPTCAGCVSRPLKNEWSSPTGTAGLEWTPTDGTLAYLKYTRGYKAGGFNSGAIVALPYTNPEHVDAFEVGLKQEIGSTLLVNTSVFYYDYQGAQVPVTVVPPTGPSFSQYVNINSARSVGAEVEATWSPTSQFQVNLSYSFLDATVEEACCYVDPTDPLALDPQAHPSGPLSASGQGQDVQGQTLPGAPRNKAALAANYTFDFSAGSLTLSGNYAWRDDVYHSIFNRSYNLAPAYGEAGFRALWSDTANNYTIITYVKNAFDEEAYDNVSASLTSTGTRNQSLTLIPPRIYGLEVQYRFGGK